MLHAKMYSYFGNLQNCIEGTLFDPLTAIESKQNQGENNHFGGSILAHVNLTSCGMNLALYKLDVYNCNDLFHIRLDRTLDPVFWVKFHHV